MNAVVAEVQAAYLQLNEAGKQDLFEHVMRLLGEQRAEERAAKV